MNRYCSLLLLSLVGCSNSSPQPPLPPPPASPWAITEGSAPQPLQMTGGVSYFDFPVCASAAACHVSYVEQPWGSPLTGKTSIALDYSITGNAPVFDAHSADNTCEPNIPHVLLILHQAGDNLSGVGPYAFYRWFSAADEQPLALGDHVLTVPLSENRWTPVYPGQAGQDAGWAGALANMGKVGLGLGGGCYASHGAAITSGTARFIIESYSVQ